MIVSYPMVNHRGEVNGGEISLRFQCIEGISHMTRWERIPAVPRAILADEANILSVSEDETDREQRVVIPNCVVICTNNQSYEVLANYDELKSMIRDFTEWDET